MILSNIITQKSSLESHKTVPVDVKLRISLSLGFLSLFSSNLDSFMCGQRDRRPRLMQMTMKARQASHRKDYSKNPARV